MNYRNPIISCFSSDTVSHEVFVIYENERCIRERGRFGLVITINELECLPIHFGGKIPLSDYNYVRKLSRDNTLHISLVPREYTIL